MLALLANAHRDPAKRRRPFSPDDFNPYPTPRQAAAKPARTIDAAQLADWVCGPAPDAEDDEPDDPVITNGKAHG